MALIQAETVLGVLQRNPKGITKDKLIAALEGTGVMTYRLGTYLWEIEQKLGHTLERQKEGREVTGYRLILDPKEARKLAAMRVREATPRLTVPQSDHASAAMAAGRQRMSRKMLLEQQAQPTPARKTRGPGRPKKAAPATA